MGKAPGWLGGGGIYKYGELWLVSIIYDRKRSNSIGGMRVRSGVTRLLSSSQRRRARGLMTLLWARAQASPTTARLLAHRWNRLPAQGNAFSTPLTDGNYRVTVKLQSILARQRPSGPSSAGDGRGNQAHWAQAG